MKCTSLKLESEGKIRLSTLTKVINSSKTISFNKLSPTRHCPNSSLPLGILKERAKINHPAGAPHEIPHTKVEASGFWYTQSSVNQTTKGRKNLSDVPDASHLEKDVRFAASRLRRRELTNATLPF